MNLETIENKAIENLTTVFNKGLGLKGNDLKNYSGKALENWTEFVVELIVKLQQNNYPDARIEFDKAYIKSDIPGCSDERLDMHIKLDGKYIYLHEDRAWLDKPFYSLKRAVFKAISVSCASQLHPDCQYRAIGFCCDFKQELVNTFDHVFGMSERIKIYSLTGRRRNMKVDGKNVNWFETGFVEQTVRDLVRDIYNVIDNAASQR